MGKLQDHSDYTAIGVLTCQYVKNLGDLDIALSYTEGQLAKLMWLSHSAVEDPRGIEAHAFHAGSLLFLAMEVSEMVKISCFGLTNAGDRDLTEFINYPLRPGLRLTANFMRSSSAASPMIYTALSPRIGNCR